MQALRRLLDSDVFYSFRRSPLTIVAAATTLVCVVAAVFAGWLAPHNPFDLKTLNLLDAFTPPAWTERGNPAYLLGTDDQGRDVLSAIMYGSRVSLMVGFFAVMLAMTIGIALGLLSGYVGGKVDAFIMRVADVQLSFPAILIALLIDGVARVALPRESHDTAALYVLVLAIAASGWVQYARTVRGSTLVERNKEYVQAARVIGRHPVAIMFSHVLPERDGAGARPRHAAHRHRDHHRGDPVLPGRRRAPHPALARHADPHRQRLPLLGGMVDHRLPRGVARDHGARDEPPGRLAARRPQPEAPLGTGRP